MGIQARRQTSPAGHAESSVEAVEAVDRAVAVDRLDEAVAILLADDVDVVDEPALRTQMSRIKTAATHLETVLAQAAASLSRREAARLRERRPDDPRADGRAKRQVAQQLADELDLGPSAANDLVDLGGQLARDGRARDAVSSGKVTGDHLRAIRETLRWVEDQDRHDELRDRLYAAAESGSVWWFRRECRRLLAEVDHDAAMAAEDRRWMRRTAKLYDTPDGMSALHAELSGLDAETVATAIHAFRRPDAPDEQRSPAQATADALVQMASAALRSAEAPTVHGVRPHVMVTIDWRQVLADAGVCDLTWTGPTPFAEVRRLLADAGVSRILTDPDGLPDEAGVSKRNVPAGLYKQLWLRDRGCVRDGCDAPPEWCDAAHLERPYGRDGLGQISLANGALACRVHHRQWDTGRLELYRDGGRPRFRPRPS